MDYLIDQNVWNLVIKKLKPKTALKFKQGFKKDPNPLFSHRDPPIKKELVLSFPERKILEHGFFEVNCVVPYGEPFLETSKQQNREIEKAILEVLIETQGMSEKTKYKIGRKKPEYVIDQYEPISNVEKGFVYLIRNQDIYKIGITDNLLRRFNQLKPDEVLNVVRCSNFESLEKELHKKFKEYRIPQTEYFRLSKNQIEQVNIEMTKGADF